MKFFNKRYVLFGFGTCFIFIIIVSIFLLFTEDYKNAKFRTMQDQIASSEPVDLTGLRELSASGGPIVDFPTLKKNLASVRKSIVIVDGMKELHGYINGFPLLFFGYHRKKPSLRQLIRRLFLTGTIHEQPALIIKEHEVTKKYGFEYKNINIGSKSLTPDIAVDEFVSYIDQPHPNVWFHFHCRHGKGRTSIMLVMTDIIKNAPKVALRDIVKRQHLLGSEDLFDTTPWLNSTYSPRRLEKRKNFIQDFYAFICQRKAGGVQLWSEWRRKPKPLS